MLFNKNKMFYVHQPHFFKTNYFCLIKNFHHFDLLFNSTKFVNFSGKNQSRCKSLDCFLIDYVVDNPMQKKVMHGHFGDPHAPLASLTEQTSLSPLPE